MEFRLETLSGGKDGWMCFCMNSRIGAWVGRYIHARMDGGYEKVNGWIDEWVRGQANGYVGYGCTDGQMNLPSHPVSPGEDGIAGSEWLDRGCYPRMGSPVHGMGGLLTSHLLQPLVPSLVGTLHMHPSLPGLEITR